MVFDPIDEISNSNAHKIIREIVTDGNNGKMLFMW